MRRKYSLVGVFLCLFVTLNAPVFARFTVPAVYATDTVVNSCTATGVHASYMIHFENLMGAGATVDFLAYTDGVLSYYPPTVPIEREDQTFLHPGLTYRATATPGMSFDFEIVWNTYSNGVQTFRHSASFTCHWVGEGYVAGPVTVVNGPPSQDSDDDPEPEPEPELEAKPGCDALMQIPESAVGGTFLSDARVYWKPGAVTEHTISAGSTARVIGQDASGEFCKVLWHCQYLWVEADTLGPNYDAVWNGAPLPTVVVE